MDNREKIIEALEICITEKGRCRNCPYYNEAPCIHILQRDALSLIKELTKENERLTADNEWLKREVNTNEEDYTKVAKNFYNKGKADTVRKMQERLKHHLEKPEFPWDSFTVAEEVIDQIAKEMLEGEK